MLIGQLFDLSVNKQFNWVINRSLSDFSMNYKRQFEPLEKEEKKKNLIHSGTLTMLEFSNCSIAYCEILCECHCHMGAPLTYGIVYIM